MKIIIVGGGTAGWLAALFISKIKPNHEITIIESSQIGIIGAGEGSTGLLTNIISNSFWDFGCDHEDFLKSTGATLKYGIKHKDWKTVGSSYFGPLDGSMTYRSVPDIALAHHVSKYGVDSAHLCSEMGLMLEHNISNVRKHDYRFENYHHALHFDAHEVGKYFKKIVLKNQKVSYIDSEVENVSLSEDGKIKSVKLKGSIEIVGDFFIDATGFKRLLSKKLDVKWISYKKNLPVNSAMPFLLDYDDDETPEPFTTAWAQSSGWMWQIPTQARKGCGYVFCDEYITAEQAQQEIETTLNKKITPIRILKFDTGRLNELWKSNCLSIGLAAAFAEPLEATSIHSTIVQLTKFVFEHLKESIDDTLNRGSIKIYNQKMNRMYDDFKDFLVMHYMGGREDSEFWKYIKSGETKTDFVDAILEMSKNKMPTFNDFNEYYGAAGWPLYSYVLLGTGNLSSNVCRKELDIDMPNLDFKDQIEKEYQELKIQYLKNLDKNISYKEFINYIKNGKV
jgi:tryptophan 6-halogenase